MNVIDKVFGASPDVLSIRSKRTELIAANLANADTPGYKARDIDFQAALSQARDSQSGMMRTHRQHMTTGGVGANVGYRSVSQTSLDGNTVETDREHSEFMENSIRYQASLNFLDGRIKSMMLALRGE